MFITLTLDINTLFLSDEISLLVTAPQLLAEKTHQQEVTSTRISGEVQRRLLSAEDTEDWEEDERSDVQTESKGDVSRVWRRR